MSDRPYVSVVAPLYNEEECLPLLYERIRDACDALGKPYEIVLVDDGSSDRTLEILLEIARRDARVRPFPFRRNYGQTAAMAAGFAEARGEIVISMDGDLQNDPDDIPRLLAKLDEGFDVVQGWRKNRQDKYWSRKFPSKIANRIIAWVTGVDVHDNGCSLKAYRASAIKNVALYGEMHRFIPAMATLAGARITEIVVKHHARQFGVSKYGLGRVWRVMLDIFLVKMIVSSASRPGRWFGLLSLPSFALGIALAIGAAVFLVGGSTEPWLVAATGSLMFLFLGTHLVSLGVIGELAMATGDFDPVRTVQPTAEPTVTAVAVDGEER